MNLLNLHIFAMNFWIKIIYLSLTILSLGMVSSLTYIYYDSEGILFESEESKTLSGGPVFNEIKWFKQGSKDIWMMKQAHHGLDSNWDRLAIIVENSFSPAKVAFYQLEPGELSWTGNEKIVGYKVPCFICHSNGPRAIRPNVNSIEKPIRLKDKVKIILWNLKIKSYGKLNEYDDQKQYDKTHSPPFRQRGLYERLQVKTCTNCHKEKGLMARGFLTRQHKATIKHMLDKGHMPPRGISLREEEKVELDLFLNGF
jgi:hypothetical protein